MNSSIVPAVSDAGTITDTMNGASWLQTDPFRRWEGLLRVRNGQRKSRKMSNGWPERHQQPAVSHSSIAKFRSCDRQWALQYHHAIIPNIETRHQFKREARLQPLNCYPGSIFHETIQIALMRNQRTGIMPTDLMAIATDIAREYQKFSREWVEDVTRHPLLGGNHPYWPNHEFAQPIDCLYFEGKFPPKYNSTVKENLMRWFDRFQKLLPELPFMSIDRKNWLFPQTPAQKIPWFLHNQDFAVYAAFDFLTREADEVSIYDWKTGKRSRGEEQVTDQLMTYAAYAMNKWKTDPENIKLYAVWVDDGSVQPVECDTYEIQRLEKIWHDHHHLWSLRLDEVNGDAERLFELFPMTNDIRTCLRCSFHSCEGRKRTAAISTVTAAAEFEFWDG